MKKFKGYILISKLEVFRYFGVLYHSAQAIYPFILLPKYIANDLENYEYQAILEHEVTHLDRAKKLGVFKWYFLYICSPKFRLKEEVIAYRVKKKFLESKDLPFDVEKHAKILSSNIYGNVVKYEKALELLSV